MIDNFNLAKEILETKGELTGKTQGNSMKPLFRSGKDNAVIVPLTQPPKKNDVLLYRNTKNDEIILHRVIKIKNGCAIYRGDNLYHNEYSIKKDDILGLLKGFYRNGKYYDCKKSVCYKLYIIYIRFSYPLRFVVHKATNLLKRIYRKTKNLLEK